jgi:hypothetical protein
MLEGPASIGYIVKPIDLAQIRDILRSSSQT